MSHPHSSHHEVLISSNRVLWERFPLVKLKADQFKDSIIMRFRVGRKLQRLRTFALNQRLLVTRHSTPAGSFVVCFCCLALLLREEMIQPPSLDPSYKVGKVQELKSSKPLKNTTSMKSKEDSTRKSGPSPNKPSADPKLSIQGIVQEENLNALKEIEVVEEKPKSIMHIRDRGETSHAESNQKPPHNNLNVQEIVHEENINAVHEIQEVNEKPKSIMHIRDRGDDEDSKAASTLHVRDRDNGNSTAAAQKHDDRVVAYKWIDGVTIPSHGDVVDPNALIRTRDDKPFDQSDNGLSFPIDEVHKEGWPHVGTWAFVTDNEQRLLLQKRGPAMVTCPNSWTLQGEHCNAHQGEEIQPELAVNRGLKEEIGDFIMQHIVREENLMKDMKALPAFFSNEYETSLGHRVDRQFTYLWYVQLNVSGDFVVNEMLKLNSYDHDEVAEMKWISVPELETLLQQRPDQFCHNTVISLLSLGIPELKKFLLN